MRALAYLAGENDPKSLTLVALRKRDGIIDPDPAAYARGDYEA